MTTADKLTYLNETKDLIKQAIVNKGVEVSTDTPFRQYADKIGEISGGGGGGGSLVPNFDYTKFTEHNLPKFIRTLGLVAGNDYSTISPRYVSYEKTVDLSTANTWEIRAGFFMPPSISDEFNIISARYSTDDKILTSYIDTNKMFRMVIGNGSSWLFDIIYGDIPLEFNKKYVMSIKYDGSNYTTSFNDRVYCSVSSEDKIGAFRYLYFGTNRLGGTTAATYRDVIYDLRDFEIYADGVKIAPV